MKRHDCPSCECEPEVARCPCDSTGECCRFRSTRHGDNCCSCHRSGYYWSASNDTPCLSSFHKQPAQSPMPLCECGEPDRPHEDSAHRKPAQPATKERVVERCVWPHSENGFGPHDSTHAPGGCRLATLIIHEPVKEPTLYEAVEQALAAYGVNDPLLYVPEVKAAYLREKAAREKEGKK